MVIENLNFSGNVHNTKMKNTELKIDKVPLLHVTIDLWRYYTRKDDVRQSAGRKDHAKNKFGHSMIKEHGAPNPHHVGYR